MSDMKYICIDISLIALSENIARTASIPSNDVLSGLIRMYAWLSDKRWHLGQLEIVGFFGKDISQHLLLWGVASPSLCTENSVHPHIDRYFVANGKAHGKSAAKTRGDQ